MKDELLRRMADVRRTIMNCNFMLNDEPTRQVHAQHLRRLEEIRAQAQEQLDALEKELEVCPAQ